MDTVLIVLLVLAGGIVFRLWQKRWHEQHGGDDRDDLYDSPGSGL